VSGAAVVIVENGGANIASLQFALRRLATEAVVSADQAVIRAARRVILPGVGAAADAMERLRARGLDRVIAGLTQPVLGICLGMQLLYEASEEGDVDCLGIIPGRIARIPRHAGLPVPHMGWNTLQPDVAHALTAGLADGDYAYFVHSYAAPRSAATLITSTYATGFSACVGWRNFFGAQFHPERSSSVGARLLQNFLVL
jgi:glutamine amidotransferase